MGEDVRYVAVVGPGEGATVQDIESARSAGTLIAARGWVTLTGGRNAGVMAAAATGARAAGGLCIGLLPATDRRDAAPALSAAIATGLGQARNAVLINAADAVIACGMNPGTLSEIALALRAGKPVALLGVSAASAAVLTEIAPNLVAPAETAESAFHALTGMLAHGPPVR